MTCMDIKMLKRIIENIHEGFTVEYNNGETVSFIGDRIEVDITNEKLILK